MSNPLLLACFTLQLISALDIQHDNGPMINMKSKECKLNDILIDGKLYCSRCLSDTDLLIDGKCVEATPETSAICISNKFGRCISCGPGYFLYGKPASYLGQGCYKIGGEPGNNICSEASGDSTVCKTCAPGYFKNPKVSKIVSPCIRCNDIHSEVKYKGVELCSLCESPESPGAAICTECEAGYFPIDEHTCKECDSVCEKCAGEGPNNCTKCVDGKYVKVTDLTTGAGSCVAESICKGGYFPIKNEGKCYLCNAVDHGGIIGCEECSAGESAVGDNTGQVIVTCTKCVKGHKLNTAKTACVPCNIDGCDHCDTNDVCAQCSDKKYFTPTNVCIDDCTIIKGYYGDAVGNQRVCKPCTGCAECKDEATKCTACPAGQILKYTDETNPKEGGVCVKQCTVSLTTMGCRNCGLQINGTRYCTACSGANEVPIDGVCVDNGSDDKSLCVRAENGTCKSCKEGYFWKDGGCYRTDRLPGKSICADAKDGTCAVCSNGLKMTNGFCEKCHPNCESCSEADKANKCLTCINGYYKSDSDAGACIPCNAVTSSCLVCVPSGNTALCLLENKLTNNGFKLGSGTLAAIAIVVIIIVGGLGGFLWWWLGCGRKEYVRI